MKTVIIFVIFLLIFPFLVKSQETSKNLNDFDFIPKGTSSQQGLVIIKADARIENMVQRHIAVNMKQKGIPGWRVQIFMGSGRDANKNAQAAKSQFLSNYPDIEVYLDYQAPYFRVKVGNYRKTDKHLALKLKKEVATLFPSSWLVEDMIDYQKL
jgi:hypothetical protein